MRICSVNVWRNTEKEKSKLISYSNEIAQCRLPEGEMIFVHSFGISKVTQTVVEVPVSVTAIKLNSIVRVKFLEMNKIITVQIVNHVMKNDLKDSI